MSLRYFLSVLKNRLTHRARPSLNQIEKQFANYIDWDNGFFIEAGAHDGYSQSNTYYLEKKRGWRGLLIEGIPSLAKKCAKRRKHSTVINCALVSDDYPSDTVTMHFAGLMSLTEGSMKTREAQFKHIKQGLKVQHLTRSYSLSVKAKTLCAILDNINNLPDIDFLSLDLEGGELDALKGLNLSKYRPKLLLIEARYFDEIDTYLRQHNYKMLKQVSHHDYLYATEASSKS